MKNDLYTNQSYHDEVTRLFDEYYTLKKATEDGESIPPRRRVIKSNALIEQYIDQHGKRPPNAVLSRLAVYILLDDLSDSHPDKMARDEYPIASYGQVGRQYDRQAPLSAKPYAQEDVMGTSKKDGVLLRRDTDEWRASDWRLFLREVLTDREATIVEGIYGRGETQAEIAEKLGVSQPRVAIIVSGIYDKLRRLAL